MTAGFKPEEQSSHHAPHNATEDAPLKPRCLRALCGAWWELCSSGLTRLFIRSAQTYPHGMFWNMPFFLGAVCFSPVPTGGSLRVCLTFGALLKGQSCSWRRSFCSGDFSIAI